MPVTCVDFQLLFNHRSHALDFVEPGLTRWETLAEEMFGITVLFVGHPFSEFPEIENPEAVFYFYGGPPRVPVIDRSRYNHAEHWDIDSLGH